ncbi:MAG TPA: radical SAM protein [Syntrophorhabdaceae bacterium]|nr:radical SAM protein [Syntrophorhabdaceae bacterium]
MTHMNGKRQINEVRVNNVQQSIDTEERETIFNRRRSFGHEETYLKNRRDWNELPEKQIVADFPLHVDIELSSVCNLKCPMCYTITDEFKSRVKTGFMDLGLFKKIVDECAEGDVFSIRLSLRGEALLHKDFIDCIRYAKEKGIKEVSTLTNGKKLVDKDFCELIVNAGLDWITVSIDGVDEVYESIRKPITFPQIKQAMMNLNEARDLAGSQKPAIKIQGVWPAVKQAADVYIDIFTPLSDLIYTNPLVDYLFCDSQGQIEYVPGFVCYQPFQRLVITSSGDALMCANDQIGEVVIGSAKDTTVHELWHGRMMEKVRDDHRTHNAIRYYQTCRDCQIPRAREYEEATVKGRKIFIENYKNRAQVIGK